MCLAVPMKLVEVGESGGGIADLDGARYEVDLTLIEDAAIGDYVIVHAGYAIERLDKKEAQERLDLFEQMGASFRNRDGNES